MNKEFREFMKKEYKSYKDHLDFKYFDSWEDAYMQLEGWLSHFRLFLFSITNYKITLTILYL